MGTPEEAKRRASATYDAAADTYDHPANSFWERYGRRTIARLALSPGARVLDACCGSGASALPAAEAVGPHGSVLGVDLAERLLDRARAKAQAQGLTNVEFRVGDLLDLGLPAGHYDAVICVFGIFFVPDMEAGVRELWHRVRPGGQLAVTTWGPRFFEPVNAVFWDAVRAVRPALYKGFNPWDRIVLPEAVSSLLQAAGCEEVSAFAQSGSQALAAPEDWWRMVMGSGYRGTVDQLEAHERERVRGECLRFIRASRVESLEANVVFGTARKGGT